MAINILSHTLVPKEFTSSILDGFTSSDSATLLLVSLAAVFSIVTQRSSPQTLLGGALRDDTKTAAREITLLIVEWRHKYIRWKGLGTRIGQIRHFVFIAGHIAIVPPTSARLYSIDYLHWGDFAELKEITVSINRFVFLPDYVRIECFQNWPQGVTPWPNANIFQSERGGSNSVSLITITGHCFPLGQKQLLFADKG